MAETANVPEEDLEDLRFAVVMNGGVSLAIWIGGVANELNRLTRRGLGRETAYGGLLDVVQSTARVDVISGTSAGGLNGAFLALATAYNQSLGPLGKLWAESGGLAELLRGPLDRHPPSLLKGDEYFLPRLRTAFENIFPAGGRGYVGPADAPLDLTITTSLMDGRVERSIDDFGTAVVETEHRARFHFSRDEWTVPGEDDPFHDPGIIGRLALASRSTASFPFAFEPSFVPIGAEHATDDHPDMRGAANFGGSRFVLDGGVLLNKPVGPALEAIFRQSARRQVRRVMFYVNPDPGSPTEPPPNDPEAPYGLPRVMTDALMSLPRAQSITQDLADLREHNRQVRDQQQMRPNLLEDLGDDAETLAGRMFESYKRVRTRLAVNRIVDTSAPYRSGMTPSWSREDLIAAFEAEAPDPRPLLPFIPSGIDLPPDGEWNWGIEPVERLGWVTLDVLRSGLLAVPVVDDSLTDADLRGRLREARGRIHTLLRQLRAFRAAEDRYWRNVARTLPAPPTVAAQRPEVLREWARRVAAGWGVPGGDPDFVSAGLRIAANGILGVFLDAEPDLRRAVELGKQCEEPVVKRHAEELERLLGTLLPSPPPTGREITDAQRTAARVAISTAVVKRLLAVEVCYVTLTGGFPPTGQDVLFMQVDGRTPNGLGGATSLDSKLAGVQLGHFGAFYKKSWRVNDWIWGRLDGATRLVEATLGPKRLRQLRYDTETVLDALRAVAVGPDEDPYLVDLWDQDVPRMTAELSFLDEPELPVPPSVPITAAAVARRMQVDVLDDELGLLSEAVKYDVAAGSLRTGRGPTFAANYDAAVIQYRGSIPPERLFSLFLDARIGEERIGKEAGTDLLAATASTAAAVTVATLDMPQVSLGPARTVLRSLRAVTLTLYALVYGSVAGSRIGAAMVNLALCAGGALLAISLLSDSSPPILTAIAAVLVVAAVAAAALRSKLWLLALAFGVPLVILIAAVLGGGVTDAVRDKAPVILTVVGLVSATALLGSVRIPSRPLSLRRGPGWRRILVPLVLPVSLVLTVITGLITLSRAPGRPLELQFAATVTRAASVLTRWARAGVLDDGREAILFDYLFLAVYWIPLAALCGAVVRRCRRLQHGSWATTGAVLSWLALYAAVLDAAENVLALLQIDHVRDGNPPASIDPILPAVTAALAGIKWAFLIAGILYVVLVGPWALLRLARRTQTAVASATSAVGEAGGNQP